MPLPMLLFFNTPRRAHTNIKPNRCVATVSLNNAILPKGTTIMLHLMISKPPPPLFQFHWNVIRFPHIWPLIRLFWVPLILFLLLAHPLVLHHTGLPSYLSSLLELHAKLIFCSLTSDGLISSSSCNHFLILLSHNKLANLNKFPLLVSALHYFNSHFFHRTSKLVPTWIFPNHSMLFEHGIQPFGCILRCVQKKYQWIWSTQ